MAYQNIIIVGGGFGGMNAARGLCKADVNLLMIDKTNHHLFQPLLYQVASAALSPGNIAMPIREELARQKNASVIMANIKEIDKKKRCVVASNGDAFFYDYLILSPGARHSYFGHEEWAPFAPGLKTLSDAVRIRERILLTFERAERLDSISEAAKYLRFVIVGGGPTGVEMAGAIAEIAHKTMFRNFRHIKPEHSEIILVESRDQLLPAYPKELALKAQRTLEKMGVRVVCNARVTEVNADGARIGDEFVGTLNVIWAAGNQASPILKSLDVPLDRGGRVVVGPDLSIPEHPEVFVIGDAAHVVNKKGESLPGIAPVAIQQGRYVANIIKKKTSPEKRKPFHYKDKGSMATMGTAKAVGIIGKKQISGFFAWLAWGLIHVFYLISFRNRVMVMLQWGFWYLTGKRHVRLIKPSIYDDTDGQPIPKDGIPSSVFARNHTKKK